MIEYHIEKRRKTALLRVVHDARSFRHFSGDSSIIQHPALKK
jgi:hypothetical protein